MTRRPKFLLSLSGERPIDTVSACFKGVGLVRGEYIYQRVGQYVTKKSARDYMRDYLTHVATLFAPKPVWYRTADLEPDTIAVLEGGENQGIVDWNQLLGTRGIRRAQVRPEEFRRELETFADVSSRFPNLGLLFPYVATREEMAWAIDQADAAGVDGLIGMMAEIPSAIIELEQFLELGVDRVVIGPSDLSRLTLGAYEIPTRYPKYHETVLYFIEKAVRDSRKHNVPLCIAVEDIDEYTLNKLIGLGVHEFSVNYNCLPRLAPEKFNTLHEADLRDTVKRRIRLLINERASRL